MTSHTAPRVWAKARDRVQKTWGSRAPRTNGPADTDPLLVITVLVPALMVRPCTTVQARVRSARDRKRLPPGADRKDPVSPTAHRPAPTAHRRRAGDPIPPATVPSNLSARTRPRPPGVRPP